jgi:hypothetical protein
MYIKSCIPFHSSYGGNRYGNNVGKYLCVGGGGREQSQIMVAKPYITQ